VGKHFIRSYYYFVHYLDCSIFLSGYVAGLLDSENLLYMTMQVEQTYSETIRGWWWKRAQVSSINFEANYVEENQT